MVTGANPERPYCEQILNETMKRIGLVLILLSLASLIARAQSNSSLTPKRVLVLHHYGREVPAIVLIDQGFENAIKSVPPGSIEFYRETLENYRFPDASHVQLMRTYLKEKYADRRIDVIVAFADTTLEFVTHYRDELFPGVPVVYLVSKHPEPVLSLPLSTGVWEGPTIKETIELALKLQPETQQVFVISGSLNDNQMVEVETRDQLKEFESRVRLNYLIDRPLDEVIARVKNLPEHSIVLCQRLTRGVGGRSVVARDGVSLIAQAANAPVYGTFDTWMGVGIVGGQVVSHEEIGNHIAQMALRIVQGTKPADIPIETSSTVPMFDWRQLRRWGISENSLPAGSIVLFKQWSFWELYRWRIVIALSVLTMQSMLIAILLVQRSKRARAESSRQISERNLQRLTGQLIHVQDEERRRVAAELHDGIGQTLSIINNRATICLNNLRDEDGLKEQLAEISEVTFAGLDEVREIAHNLRPYELDRLGLVHAVESMVEKVSDSTSIQISSDVDDIDGQLSRDAETGIYRILQEGLNNVLKHANASEARVSIKREGKELLVALSDNGRGFNRHPAGNGDGKGFGLAGITERARMLQAKCTIESALGRGTNLSVRIPMDQDVDGK